MEQELLFLFPSRNLGMRLRKIIAIGNTKGENAHSATRSK
jgi:hypothetical protein